MSVNYLTHLPMENTTRNTIPLVYFVAACVFQIFSGSLLVRLFGPFFGFLLVVFACFVGLCSFFFLLSRFYVPKLGAFVGVPTSSFSITHVPFADAEGKKRSETCEYLKVQVAKKNDDHLDSTVRVAEENHDIDLHSCSEKKEDVRRGDAEEVMERLGISCRSEDGKLQGSLDSDEFSKLFEEKEPSLEEVKGAFEVFDVNGDGFIDSKELQRVLCALGLKEGGEVENCRRMIGLFDENRDGRIDFGEFVKIMENSFC